MRDSASLARFSAIYASFVFFVMMPIVFFCLYNGEKQDMQHAHSVCTHNNMIFRRFVAPQHTLGSMFACSTSASGELHIFN